LSARLAPVASPKVKNTDNARYRILMSQSFSIVAIVRAETQRWNQGEMRRRSAELEKPAP
jgi:hypothetical protein